MRYALVLFGLIAAALLFRLVTKGLRFTKTDLKSASMSDEQLADHLHRLAVEGMWNPAVLEALARLLARPAESTPHSEPHPILQQLPEELTLRP